MKYFAETEKAVKLMIEVELTTIDRDVFREVWVPKSQLADNGFPGEWITEQKVAEIHPSAAFSMWHAADGETCRWSMTAKEAAREAAREQKFEAGKKAYEDLIARAKAAGVKGVRVGMRRATIEAKLAAAVA